MDSQASTLPPLTRAHRLPSVGFGPYLLLEATPWLLLATATRMRARHTENLLALPLIVLVQFAVLIAFLVASQRMIAIAGGTTDLGRLSFREQVALSRGVIGRMLVLSFATIVLATQLGVDKFTAAYLWMGVDGIVFNWRSDALMVWSALTAVILFLMIVEKGAGRRPLLKSAMREFARRWRRLAKALVAIVVVQMLCNFVQEVLGDLLDPLYQQPKPMLLRNLLYLGFYFVFAYVRLWVTVAILTYALRASYRQGEGTLSGEPAG